MAEQKKTSQSSFFLPYDPMDTALRRFANLNIAANQAQDDSVLDSLSSMSLGPVLQTSDLQAGVKSIDSPSTMPASRSSAGIVFASIIPTSVNPTSTIPTSTASTSTRPISNIPTSTSPTKATRTKASPPGNFRTLPRSAVRLQAQKSVTGAGIKKKPPPKERRSPIVKKRSVTSSPETTEMRARRLGLGLEAEKLKHQAIFCFDTRGQINARGFFLKQLITCLESQKISRSCIRPSWDLDNTANDREMKDTIQRVYETADFFRVEFWTAKQLHKFLKANGEGSTWSNWRIERYEPVIPPVIEHIPGTPILPFQLGLASSKAKGKGEEKAKQEMGMEAEWDIMID